MNELSTLFHQTSYPILRTLFHQFTTPIVRNLSISSQIFSISSHLCLFVKYSRDTSKDEHRIRDLEVTNKKDIKDCKCASARGPKVPRDALK